MRTDLADRLFTVAGLLSADECTALIERGEELGFERAAVRTAAGPRQLPGVRDNDRAAFADPGLAGELWQRLRPFVPDAADGATPVGSDAEFRFYRYDVGQRFNRHKDGVVAKSPGVESRLTCLFTLNGDFRGGKLRSTPTTWWRACGPRSRPWCPARGTRSCSGTTGGTRSGRW